MEGQGSHRSPRERPQRKGHIERERDFRSRTTGAKARRRSGPVCPRSPVARCGGSDQPGICRRLTVSEKTFLEAIREGLREEMARERAVYILGEDVAVGGPFGATKGLADEFGTNRVVNTPISEGTVVGLATGAALLGFRPVVEIMFIDFITLAMDQLVNHAAKLHYMSGGQLRGPLTIRAQEGAVGSCGAHHSQSLESWFLHVPGLKVGMPSNPADATGILKAALR